MNFGLNATVLAATSVFYFHQSKQNGLNNTSLLSSTSRFSEIRFYVICAIFSWFV